MRHEKSNLCIEMQVGTLDQQTVQSESDFLNQWSKRTDCPSSRSQASDYNHAAVELCYQDM